ncbi:MAG TPA: MOSC domain-containing protein [Bryobacteraceae bacterium]|nr:MOSC domain-containing protein [Bryobacteraceae bacterium]
MRVLSVNVGAPRQAPNGDRTVLTSIFKQPVPGRVAVRRHNLDGDQQSDLTVHGGPHKAVYCYPSEHYEFWKTELPGMDLPYPMFGENLTTQGLAEEVACIGDQFRFGSAVLQVTQPRMPCFKLGVRFGRPDIVKRFWRSGRPGMYFSVVEEGEVSAGDTIERTLQAEDGISVADVVRLYRGEERSPDLLERALRAPLFGGWKDGLRERL